MTKSKIIALVLLGLMAVLCVVNRGFGDGVGVDLLVDTVRLSKSMLMLACTAVGVVVGVLLK
jgi:hypothetical protein